MLAIYLGYFYGDLAYAPAFYHEYIQPKFDKGQVPGTDQDWESSKRGINLGEKLSYDVPLYELYRGYIVDKHSFFLYDEKCKMSNLGNEIYNIITYVKPKK